MQTFDRFYRSAVLGVAGNKVVQDIVRQRGGSLVSRFVAGEDLHQALAALDRLESEGVHGILDLLGESVTSEEQARAFTAQITEIVDALAAKPYPRYVSIKLTQLGLDLSTDLALENARAIVSRAAPSGTFVRIDMEDSPRIDRTLAIYRTLREGFDNVGIVLQAYLYRTEGDLEDLAELRPNVRIVKGAYLEPPELAYSDKAAVDAQFRRVFYRAVELGCHAAAATHDESIIRDVKYYAQQQGLPRDRFEFQLLYGIRHNLQRSLAAEGYLVRAYIPYGREWYAYFSRRIAERPANVAFLLRGLVRG